MKYVLGGVWIAVCLWVLLGMVAGRVELRSCCPSDPARDLRMREAREAASPAPAPVKTAISHAGLHLDERRS